LQTGIPISSGYHLAGWFPTLVAVHPVARIRTFERITELISSTESSRLEPSSETVLTRIL
jgi:hypothetical protein